ncbi:MAG: DUF5615 family PIN-like protein [Bacteroidales bacterium]|nr:DUF5615 family PIN-like protein [Bacteroidales bacterium]
MCRLNTKEEKWHGAEDRFLLEKALGLKRFVLTHDSDFGNLIINAGQKFYGIIYLRLKSQHVKNVIEVLEKFFRIELDIKDSQIIVVTEDKIRVRNVT